MSGWYEPQQHHCALPKPGSKLRNTRGGANVANLNAHCLLDADCGAGRGAEQGGDPKADDKWSEAFNKGDATTLAAMNTEDAYVLPPGADMVKGRSGIEAFWRQQIQQIGDVKCTTLDVKPLGGNATREIGTCSFKTKAQPPQDRVVKYAVVWEEEGGQWKLLQDIWNTSK